MTTAQTYSSSKLEHILRAGTFAVTAEISPPDSANPADVLEGAEVLSGAVDAMNATDASGAHSHMSSVAVCAILAQNGYEPILQIACRDKNRIAIQGDVLGAAALGVKNILCLTGDDVTNGDHPEAKRVFDFDCMQLIRTVKTMRDEKTFLSGRKISDAPQVLIGAASNPFVPPHDWRPYRMAKKIEAGANFFQTQYCYDMPRLRAFMKVVNDMGLPEKAHILIGIGPLKSDRMAEFLRTRVPGVHIPDDVIERLRKMPKGQKKAEGIKMCIEMVQEIKEMQGISGIHVMAYRNEESVHEIVDGAGLLPRPIINLSEDMAPQTESIAN